MAAAAVGVEEAAALQAVARGTGWTYSLLWRLCPRQRALVWAEGHYNGAIRTRKTTVAPGGGGGGDDDGEEEAARRRSRELRELYGSLAGDADGAGGDAGQQVGVARRPGAAALAPEDLTETEWFYLMCASYCFPPARGLPGEAFARRGHVWLCGANKVDSKVFSRAILARSAGIQTVACIPVDDGVLEIGTTENVEEDIGLVQYARSIFMDQLGTPIMPTLSGHSTSTPTTHINHRPFRMKMEKCILQPNNFDPEGERIEMEGDGDRIDSETNTENDSCQHPPLDSEATPNAWSSEVMRIETSERVRDGCSNLVNGNMPVQDEIGPWHLLYGGLSSKYLQSSAEDQAVLTENTHYIKTVLTILRYNACRQTQQAAVSNIRTNLSLSKNSSFSRWNPNKGKTTNDLQRTLITDCTPQRMLKSIILFSAHTNNSHQKRHRGDAKPSLDEPIRDDGGEGTSRRSRRRQAQAAELMSASHVVRERQRREKLNERFIVLRSLVPFVTKMDRASILGDTIEYVKQLRRRIQDLESRSRAGRLQIDDGNPTAAAAARAPVSKEKRAHCAAIMAVETTTSRSKVMRAVEAISSSCSTSGSGGGGGGAGRPPEPAAEAASTEVQVSIIGSDALLELRCRRRDGLLLRVMQALHRELGMEVTAVQASSAGDVLLVELRAKVKEVHGRRSSINEVKRRIHLIISSTD